LKNHPGVGAEISRADRGAGCPWNAQICLVRVFTRWDCQNRPIRGAAIAYKLAIISKLLNTIQQRPTSAGTIRNGQAIASGGAC